MFQPGLPAAATNFIGFLECVELEGTHTHTHTVYTLSSAGMMLEEPWLFMNADKTGPTGHLSQHR